MPILLIEDDVPTRFAYAQLLTRAGFVVREAVSGQDALDLLEGGFQPAVVVSDMRLPGVDGPDIVSTMHDDPILRYVPIVVVTGLPPEEVHVSADAVLFKPIDAAAFVGVIRRLHDKHTGHRPPGRRENRRESA